MSQSHFFEGPSFLHKFAVLTLLYIKFTFIVRSVSRPCLMFCWSISIPGLIPHHFCSKAWELVGQLLYLIPFSQEYFLFCHLHFQIPFKISFSSTKNLTEVLIVIALNLYINLKRTNIFTISNYPAYEDHMSLHLFRSVVSFNEVL